MNIKLIVGGVIAVAVVVMIGLTIFNNSEPETPVGTFVDDDFVVTRPDVQARPNTFNVMTPEEKAAADEARAAAEQAAQQASSTASTTSSSTDNTTQEDSDEQEDSI